MKTKINIAIFFLQVLMLSLSIPVIIYSQTEQDTIASKWGSGFMHQYVYGQHNHSLNRNKLTTILKTDKQAYNVMKSANNLHRVATIVAYSGLAIAIAGESQDNLTIGFSGVGIACVSFTMFSISNKKTKKAVDIFNSGLRETGYYNPEFEIRAALTSNGVGVNIYF